MKGGARPGAGRPKGLQNRKTIEQAEAVAKEGITPLAYLLQVMRDESADPDKRIDCAKAAAQYVHPKLSALTADLNHSITAADALDAIDG